MVRADAPPFALNTPTRLTVLCQSSHTGLGEGLMCMKRRKDKKGLGLGRGPVNTVDSENKTYQPGPREHA